MYLFSHQHIVDTGSFSFIVFYKINIKNHLHQSGIIKFCRHFPLYIPLLLAKDIISSKSFIFILPHQTCIIFSQTLSHKALYIASKNKIGNRYSHRSKPQKHVSHFFPRTDENDIPAFLVFESNLQFIGFKLSMLARTAVKS